MKRALIVTGLVAMGLLVASSFAAAQEPAKTSGGQIVIGALGAENVSSSKFTEYREVPKGISIPYVNIFATKGTFDVNLNGYNVRQKDQRYTGNLSAGWLGLSFDYNQIPHNIGNDGKTIYNEVVPGVWALSDTLQLSHMNTLDATPSAARTYDFVAALLAPSFGAANSVDISGLRKRGTAELEFGGDSPFDVTVSYMAENRTGYKGILGASMYTGLSGGTINTLTEVPEGLNSLTQDFGLRAAYNFKAGNVHAAFNRNIYNNKAETTVVDNPFQAYDVAWLSTNIGGGASNRWIGAPDNEANTTSGGFLLKFARQTRLSGDLAFSAFTQDAAFYPYTINSAILTTTGARADQLSSLQQKSFDGKINTTTLNFSFVSRPVEGLGIRASYRSYDLTNKTNRVAITGNAGGNSPERNWATYTVSAADPYGAATANVYDNSVKRFTGSVSYDIADLTLEAVVRSAKITRSSREADTGKDNGYAFAALYHASDWLGFRGTFDAAKRTADGETLYGFQSDEAERETKRTSLDIELTPTDAIGLTFAYGRRDVTYPNRPNRIAVTSGAPTPGASPIPGTPSGLLGAKYDSYTAEIEFSPNEKVELGAYYTYEKDRTENQWSTTSGVALANFLNYTGTDKTNTFGANAVIHFVPEKWTFTLNAMRQKVDGLMDVTAKSSTTFTQGRNYPVLSPADVWDINDWDDTELTTVNAQLDYAVAKVWNLGVGYMYEKYDFADAYTSGTTLMPINFSLMLKANNGAYNANVVYAKLSYTF